MPRTLGECSQLAVNSSKGGGTMRGRGGRTSFDSQKNNDKDKGKDTISYQRGGYRGGRFGGGRGSNVFTGRCFHCNEVGHLSFRCPKWNESNQSKDKRVHLVQEEEAEPKILLPEEGECLLLRKSEPFPQATIFRSKHLVQGKVCNFIID